jgi:hypothetical protein
VVRQHSIGQPEASETDRAHPGKPSSLVEVLASENGGLARTRAASLRDSHRSQASARDPGPRLGLEVSSEAHEAGWEAVAFEADAFDGATERGGLGGGERQFRLFAECAFDEGGCVPGFGAGGEAVEFDQEQVRLIAVEGSTIEAVWQR